MDVVREEVLQRNSVILDRSVLVVDSQEHVEDVFPVDLRIDLHLRRRREAHDTDDVRRLNVEYLVLVAVYGDRHDLVLLI